MLQKYPLYLLYLFLSLLTIVRNHASTPPPSTNSISINLSQANSSFLPVLPPYFIEKDSNNNTDSSLLNPQTNQNITENKGKIELSHNASLHKPQEDPRTILDDDGDHNFGAEFLHILVWIVIVLAGIGVLVALLAFISFLLNYCKRRRNVKLGSRPGTENLLLLDNAQNVARSQKEIPPQP